LGADRDHLTVGAVHLASAYRQPAGERPVKLGERVIPTTGDHMVAYKIATP
jgi:hypothetical protein